MKGTIVSKAATVAGYLLADPKYLRPYFRYLRATPLDVELPWLVFGAIYFLNNWLKPQYRIFEYGTGGSTLYFARRCHEVVSVENDAEWLRKTQNVARASGLPNLRFIMEPNTRTPSAVASPYCQTLAAVYDVILVDCFCNWPEGDLRAPCFARAEHFISPGGIIVLDDPLMCPVISTKSKRHLEFRGLKPCQYGTGSTNIYFY